ncbi:hypothetical protein B296_00048243 [Ensete ventricosum]|uniref:Uncharacterized protein n=1 Tax=Ensete ventricosum TaxID=4639 RepID=A0A426YN30_ENSVE|nr:hypothetical protein B296_00048243 [Ensete ventricosum]
MLSCSSENVGSFCSEQLHHFDVLPVDRSCIWCQARGSAAELSGLQGAVTGAEKVVVSAVVYLKPKKTQGSTEEWSLPATMLLDYDKHEFRKLEEDASIRLLSKTFEDVEDMIFMKPLHIRLRFECADHPAGKTIKETICTDSTIKVAISLN